MLLGFPDENGLTGLIVVLDLGPHLFLAHEALQICSLVLGIAAMSTIFELTGRLGR